MRFISTIPILVGLSWIGCGGNDADTGATGSTATVRQPWSPGKADIAASCANQCGSTDATSAGCYCDDQCESFQDCCPDYGSQCGGSDCPNPNDPNVEYFNCFAMEYATCKEGQDVLIDPGSCGCACVGKAQTPTCPDTNDPTVHSFSCFQYMNPCTSDQEMFVDPGGCGCFCIDIEKPTECPNPEDPTVHYFSCFTFDADPCDPNQEMLNDPSGCGCACIDKGLVCPDPNDPNVEYFSCNQAMNPCQPGQQMFVDPDCGCACIGETNECPDPNDPNVEYVSCFSMNAIHCDQDQEVLVDPGGCGCACIDVEKPSECPDPADPKVNYYSCFAFNIQECPKGATSLVDPNGCGCACIEP